MRGSPTAVELAYPQLSHRSLTSGNEVRRGIDPDRHRHTHDAAVSSGGDDARMDTGSRGEIGDDGVHGVHGACDRQTDDERYNPQHRAGTHTNNDLPGTHTNNDLLGTHTNNDLPGTHTNNDLPGTHTNNDLPGTHTNTD